MVIREWVCARHQSRITMRLVRDPMLELPDAERGEQQTFCPGKGSNGGQFSFAGCASWVLPRATTFCFRFAGTARGFADGEMAGVIHGRRKSSLRASTQRGGDGGRSSRDAERLSVARARPSTLLPLVRRSVLYQLASSWLGSGNWGWVVLRSFSR